jgi:ribosomal protein S18 acetylase RimI-like enzyme
MTNPLGYVPSIELRPLTDADVPRLTHIRPTYKSATILEVQRFGEGLAQGWQLAERTLPQPFDKGTMYDFDAERQADIRERLSRPDETYLRVADYEGLLVGVVDVELQAWNDTAYVWNLMVDVNYRRNGIGRRLWHRARDFAKQSGVRALLIETQNTNIPACRFYERMGCRLVGLHETMYANRSAADAEGMEFALFWSYPL